MPRATRDEMQQLQGMFARAARWDERNEMSSYLKDPTLMPLLHSFDGATGDDGYVARHLSVASHRQACRRLSHIAQRNKAKEHFVSGLQSKVYRYGGVGIGGVSV